MASAKDQNSPREKKLKNGVEKIMRKIHKNINLTSKLGYNYQIFETQDTKKVQFQYCLRRKQYSKVHFSQRMLLKKSADF